MWNSQNKILPGCYINFLTNTPLSIIPGERGTVLLLQEMSKGEDSKIYVNTATSSSMPEGSTAEDKILVNEALKGAKTVKVYKLPKTHSAEAIEAALSMLKTVEFDVICYPYTNDANKQSIVKWIKSMRDDEGRKIQAVLENCLADSEAVINVVQGIKLSDGTVLTAAQTTAWVSGITAGAYINKSNTNQKYIGAVDVVPKMTKSEMETAIEAGKFVFKTDSIGNVYSVYDINSFTTFTSEKGKMFRKNRVIRVIDGINNDIVSIFESNYVGKEDNNAEGRSKFRAVLVDYFKELQRLNAVQNFDTEDVKVLPGIEKDAIIINCNIQPVDSVEKIYMKVSLS